MLLFRQLSLNGQSADLLFQWISPVVSHYLLHSIMMDDQQRLWMFLFSWVLMSSSRQWRRIGVWNLFRSHHFWLPLSIREKEQYHVLYQLLHCYVSWKATLWLALSKSWLRNTTKVHANVFSPKSNLAVVAIIGSSNWLFVSCNWKRAWSSILKMLVGACFLILSNSFWAIVLT